MNLLVSKQSKIGRRGVDKDGICVCGFHDERCERLAADPNESSTTISQFDHGKKEKGWGGRAHFKSSMTISDAFRSYSCRKGRTCLTAIFRAAPWSDGSIGCEKGLWYSRVCSVADSCRSISSDSSRLLSCSMSPILRLNFLCRVLSLRRPSCSCRFSRRISCIWSISSVRMELWCFTSPDSVVSADV